MSGRSWFEGQPGLAEESGDETGLPLDAVQLVPHRGRDLVGGPGGSGLPMLFFIADQAPSTEIRPVPRPETRTTVVCLRRPQLRAFGGYSSCPDSSSKQIPSPPPLSGLLSPRPAARGCDGVLVPLAARRAATCAVNPRRCSRYETPRSA
jgi:hypothetical protein